MDSAQELYNVGLNSGWNRITIWDNDDLSNSIKRDMLWIKPFMSKNEHDILASYHALYKNSYYPIEFINGD